MLYSIVIGQNIVALRHAMHITQEALAFDANISISRLRDIEHGCANSSIDTLESIAQVLEVMLPALFLLSWNDEAILDMIHKVAAITACSQTETA